MNDISFIKLGGKYYAVSEIASISPLGGGDVIVTFTKPSLRDAGGQPTTDLRVTGAEAEGLLTWMRRVSFDPTNPEQFLPDRFT